MDRPVKFWEFLSIVFSFAIAVATLGYNYGTTVAETKMRVTVLEAKTADRDKEYREDKAEINRIISNINNNIFDIKILLQDKQDRKK